MSSHTLSVVTTDGGVVFQCMITSQQLRRSTATPLPHVEEEGEGIGFDMDYLYSVLPYNIPTRSNPPDRQKAVFLHKRMLRSGQSWFDHRYYSIEAVCAPEENNIGKYRNVLNNIHFISHADTNITLCNNTDDSY